MFMTRRYGKSLRGMRNAMRYASSQYNRNSQIYIHESPNGYKYSFSPKENSIPIGVSKNLQSINPDNFKVNPQFVDILQDTLRKHTYNDFTFVMEAGVNASAYMAIYDLREIPKYSRIPEVENILGYVQVDVNGKMVPDSYERNELYRICNGTAGLPKLSEYLYPLIQEQCESK
ncbi:uncharacterized protein RJT21DRAFT_127548 [Scheffersomyces amazonensis]|uniref:uncharacterized protein n=1 Tax=Scheffersomyces amazonensis TaxID=1078765 RepID=UPI00315C8917